MSDGVKTSPVSDERAIDESDALPQGLSIESVVEAVLFSSDKPLSAGRIAQILDVGNSKDVQEHVQTLNERYAETGASFRIQAIAHGYQMLTLEVYDKWLGRLFTKRSEARLSQAALETLAVVAYKQPSLRADVESIRGVAVGDVLSRLRHLKLVKVVGRADEIGRPLLYGTTNRFLEVFGLASLKDLPNVEELPAPKAAASQPGKEQRESLPSDSPVEEKSPPS